MLLSNALTMSHIIILLITTLRLLVVDIQPIFIVLQSFHRHLLIEELVHLFYVLLLTKHLEQLGRVITFGHQSVTTRHSDGIVYWVSIVVDRSHLALIIDHGSQVLIVEYCGCARDWLWCIATSGEYSPITLRF